MNIFHSAHARHGLAAVALALAVPAWATGTPAKAPASNSTYQQERAACAAAGSAEARTSCLRDIGAARQQAQQKGTPRSPSAEQLQENALKRCDVHAGLEERAICVRMMSGDGSVSGSVSGGGLLRELETPIPNSTQ
ncbi:MAG: hypothetical protein IBJ14_10035 [Hydrogenophaga sp.]|nr:hypothetical protein [Hydrogenophaga sp.]